MRIMRSVLRRRPTFVVLPLLWVSTLGCTSRKIVTGPELERRASAENVRLVLASGDTVWSHAAPASAEVRAVEEDTGGRGALLGALGGGVVALAVAMPAASVIAVSRECCVGVVFLSGAIGGAVVGGIVGWVTSKDRYELHPRAPSIYVVPTREGAQAGLGLSF